MNANACIVCMYNVRKHSTYVHTYISYISYHTCFLWFRFPHLLFFLFFLHCFYHTFMQLCRFPHPLLLCTVYNTLQYIIIDPVPKHLHMYQSTYICNYLAGLCMHQYSDPSSRPYVYIHVPTPTHPTIKPNFSSTMDSGF